VARAGASARIENYLGFPTGITGMALMGRAYSQAQKFGAEMAIPDEAVGIQALEEPGAGHYLLRLVNNERVTARSVVIATGARYRRLDIQNLDDFEASSVHYWATPLEGKLCAGQEVALVGAGNSAGQAAVYLASQAAKVWLLVRGKSMHASMSRYLVDRITGLSNVEVVTEAQMAAMEGSNGMLDAICWRRSGSDETVQRAIRHLFLFIGAVPSSEWLSGFVRLDRKGFVLTGPDVAPGTPLLQTSRRGVFAVGDVRSGSVKRVGAAIGEGAQVVAAVHTFLAAPPPDLAT
jgi:thioredoxin reductase (NADPH)